LASGGVGTAAGPVSILGRVAFGQKVINHIKLWDVAKGSLIWTSAEGDLGQVTSLIFSPDGKSLFCCDLSATSRIDARKGAAQARLDEDDRGQAQVSYHLGFVYSPGFGFPRWKSLSRLSHGTRSDDEYAPVSRPPMKQTQLSVASSERIG
jgi:WD40 repeat protein